MKRQTLTLVYKLLVLTDSLRFSSVVEDFNKNSFLVSFGFFWFSVWFEELIVLRVWLKLCALVDRELFNEFDGLELDNDEFNDDNGDMLLGHEIFIISTLGFLLLLKSICILSAKWWWTSWGWWWWWLSLLLISDSFNLNCRIR